jgi:hypothetical protein
MNASRLAVIEDIGQTTLEPFQEQFKRFEGHVLLAHFHPMQRRGGNTQLAGEGRQAHRPAPRVQEPAKLLLQGLCHAHIVPGAVSQHGKLSFDVTFTYSYDGFR